MKAIMYQSIKSREAIIGAAMQAGARKHGIDFEIVHKYEGVIEDADIAVTIAVKGPTKQIMEEYRAAGKHVIYIDKGYYRINSGDPDNPLSHWRVAVDAYQPLAYFQDIPRPPDRWDMLSRTIHKRRNEGNDIVFAGSSEKYHRLHELPHPTEYAKMIINQIRIQRPTSRIIYRPKPSWKAATEIEGTTFSGGKRKLIMELAEACALVTHGSNAALDSLMFGVPVLVLGKGIASPLSMRRMEDLRTPWIPKRRTIQQWGQDVAYCQWTLDEMRSGEAWATIKERLD